MTTTSRLGQLGLICVVICLGHSLSPNSARAESPRGEDTVARVGDVAIAYRTLELAAAAEALPLRLQLSEVYRAQLQRLIQETLFEREASKRGITREQFMADEVLSHVEEPTEDALRAFYGQHQDELGSFGFEVVRSRLRQHLMAQAQSERERVVTEALAAKTPVTRHLEPLRLDVETTQSASAGPSSAPISIVAFSDFECPYCARGASTLETLRSIYGDKLQVVFRHFPLSFHAHGVPAAIAAECARDQNAFWPFHDRLFEHQNALSRDELIGHAKALSLKVKPFTVCLDGDKHKGRVAADQQTGNDLGLSGAPAYFVNGRPVLGALPVEAFSEIIEEELSKIAKP